MNKIYIILALFLVILVSCTKTEEKPVETYVPEFVEETPVSLGLTCADLISESELLKACPGLSNGKYEPDNGELKSICYSPVWINPGDSGLDIETWYYESAESAKQAFEDDIGEWEIKKKGNLLGFGESSALGLYHLDKTFLKFTKNNFEGEVSTSIGQEAHICSDEQLIEIGKIIYKNLP